MTEHPQTHHEEMLYKSRAFPQSHPDRLATLASLFGMSPAPLQNCRVLELGCASGSNLIPLALELPESQFVGIDGATGQIAEGRAMADSLGLSNIEFRQLEFTDLDPDLGHFDYIICHDVYSRVPTTMQDKILEICQQHLADNGVVYMSYNTYPGWHMRGMIRDMMRYHAGMFAETPQRVGQARGLLDFLAKSVPTENNAYGMLLKAELEMLQKQPDWYLEHEHLEEVNEPVYFHQFAECATKHGFQYLGEAEFSTMLARNFPGEVAETLHKVAPDIIRMEQYMDFLRNRTFRQTLLVRQDVRLNRDVRPEALTDLYVASPARPVSEEPDIYSDAPEQFRAPNGIILKTPNPISKTALMLLAERWPQATAFTELCTAARTRLNENTPAEEELGEATRDAEVLGADLLQGYTAAMLELRMQVPRFVLDVSERPEASPLARLQAEKGTQVTNLRNEPVNLNEFDRQLVRHLDGSHDHDAMLEILADLVAQGVLEVQQHGKPLTEATVVRKIIAEALQLRLPTLARIALLIR